MNRTTRPLLGLALGVLAVAVANPTWAAGNPDGDAVVPPQARAVDTSSPDRYVGNGTRASCTSRKVVQAVAKGGLIRFRCGKKPLTIKMKSTAKVRNDRPNVVLDGRGKITLSGQGARRILYMNTCDPKQVWTTDHCQNQDHPTLTVQNLTFRNGRSHGTETMDGGGAIFVRGGRFKIMNSSFFGNRCASTGPDIGGAAVQVFSQYQGLPVYVVKSTFGGWGKGRNACSNGGAISSIHVSWTFLNSLFRNNRAIGSGANPPKAGKPGGGNGGAIYNDGNTYRLTVCGSELVNNSANQGGGAIFYVSNDRSGSLVVADSTLRDNPSAGFETEGYPGIFVQAADDPEVSGSTLE
jgi:hypothetical protein